MDKIEQLKAKQAKELADAIRHEQIKETVKAALGFTDDSFSPGYMHVHRADCFVNVEAETLPDAMVMCERMGPLQAVRLKGTFLSFRADRTVTDKDREGVKEETLIPYYYVIDGLRQHQEEKTLTWFVDARGLTVEVRCKVKQDPDTYRDYRITFDKNGNARKERNDLVNKSGYFHKYDRFWSPDDQPSRFVLWEG
jgi:hypothetical protein